MKMELQKNKNEKKLQEEIAFPSDVQVTVSEEKISMKKGDKIIERIMHPLVHARIDGNTIILYCNKSRKIERRMLGTFAAHVKNMIKGFSEPFKYKLQVVNVHFPMTVTHDKEKKEIVIKNFLGEKKERRVKVVDGVNVKINKDIIELESHDIEKAGRVATNIEKGSRVKNKDRRIYQDGIFITEKPGRSYL
jgi:large subunit ribosomal protein L6